MGMAVEATPDVVETVSEGEAKAVPRRRGEASANVDWAWTWGRRVKGVWSRVDTDSPPLDGFILLLAVQEARQKVGRSCLLRGLFL